MSERKKKLLPEGIDRAVRTEFLNNAMRSVIPSICVERAGIVTKSYQRTEGMPYVLRRAHALKDLLAGYVAVTDQLALTQPRHMEAIQRAVRHLEDARKTARSLTLDLAATALQAAQAALSEITGDRADEKLLDRVFSRFCVGK